MSQYSSTRFDVSVSVEHGWREAGLRYYAYSWYLRQRFGERIQKVSLDAKFTCPNVDGTVAKGGCTFCDNRSFSPSRREPIRDITDQLANGMTRLKRRYKVDKFIAYFQPATNTYASVERLRPLYEQSIDHEKVVGLSIGTRPDCVGPDVMDLLEEFAGRTYLTVEYGMQTIHDRSLDWMNRGHHHDATVDAIERSRGRGFEICLHVILGLPHESHEDMMATAAEVARLNIDAVKIHNLYCVKNTKMADQVGSGEVTLMERQEYITTLVDFLERIPANVLVERTIGDAPPDYFVGPSWCLDKSAVLRAIDDELVRRDTWQGKLCESSQKLDSTSRSIAHKKDPSGSVSRVLSCSKLQGQSFLYGVNCSTSLAAYPAVDDGPDEPVSCCKQHEFRLFALLRVGFTKPTESPQLLVRSYRTISPLPFPEGTQAVSFLRHFP